MENIKFAFAVNNDNMFERKHFGDADKYLIYEYDSKTKEIELIQEKINDSKEIDETHGSVKKGKSVIQSIKSIGVRVLVSIQFGPNIKMVNKHFIPIMVSKESPQDVVDVIKVHVKWIEDELAVEKEEYKVFKVNNGVFKYSIK